MEGAGAPVAASVPRPPLSTVKAMLKNREKAAQEPSDQPSQIKHRYAPGIAESKGHYLPKRPNKTEPQQKPFNKRKRSEGQNGQQKDLPAKKQRTPAIKTDQTKNNQPKQNAKQARPSENQQAKQQTPKDDKNDRGQTQPKPPPNSRNDGQGHKRKRADEAKDQKKRPEKKTKPDAPKPEDPSLAGLSRRQKKKLLAQQKKKKQIFQYGNNIGYYSYRNHYEAEADPRLKVLQKEWLAGKRCLDIGCNVGIVTLEIARQFACRSMVGVDIDEKLIARGQSYLNSHKNKNKPPLVSNKPLPGQEEGTPILPSESITFPDNVTFRAGNIIDDSVEPGEGLYDVITCFSVTKWIHLNWGDEGIRKLFAKVYKLLTSDGVFILEPQQWHSYKKKAKLTETIQENYKNIQLRPYFFKGELLEKIGFASCQVIKEVAHAVEEKEGVTPAVFALPIYVYRKNKDEQKDASDSIQDNEIAKD